MINRKKVKTRTIAIWAIYKFIFQVLGTVSRNNIVAVSHFYWVSIAGSK